MKNKYFYNKKVRSSFKREIFLIFLFRNNKIYYFNQKNQILEKAILKPNFDKNYTTQNFSLLYYIFNEIVYLPKAKFWFNFSIKTFFFNKKSYKIK